MAATEPLYCLRRTSSYQAEMCLSCARLQLRERMSRGEQEALRVAAATEVLLAEGLFSEELHQLTSVDRTLHTLMIEAANNVSTCLLRGASPTDECGSCLAHSCDGSSECCLCFVCVAWEDAT